jgi:hypothetical protein
VIPAIKCIDALDLQKEDFENPSEAKTIKLIKCAQTFSTANLICNDQADNAAKADAAVCYGLCIYTATKCGKNATELDGVAKCTTDASQCGEDCTKCTTGCDNNTLKAKFGFCLFEEGLKLNKCRKKAMEGTGSKAIAMGKCVIDAGTNAMECKNAFDKKKTNSGRRLLNGSGYNPFKESPFGEVSSMSGYPELELPALTPEEEVVYLTVLAIGITFVGALLFFFTRFCCSEKANEPEPLQESDSVTLDTEMVAQGTPFYQHKDMMYGFIFILIMGYFIGFGLWGAQNFRDTEEKYTANFKDVKELNITIPSMDETAQLIAQLQTGVVYIGMYSLALGLFETFLFVLLVRCCPGGAVRLSVIFSLFMNLMAILVNLPAVATAVYFFIIFVVRVLWYCYNRKRLAFCIELVSQAMKLTTKNPGPLILSVLFGSLINVLALVCFAGS